MLLILYKNRSDASKIWHEVLKWWIDDEIKIRFVEVNKMYRFIMYCETRILETTWVFVKTLQVSEYYKKFKNTYRGRAFLGQAVYRPKGDSYTLHILKNTKNITDVQFLQESDVEEGSIIWRCNEALRTKRD